MSDFTLLPAVDVVDGQAVRLDQGEAGTEKSYGSPLEAALEWQAQGAEWLHFVDLDAAFNRGSNHELMAEITRQLDVITDQSSERLRCAMESARAVLSAIEAQLSVLQETSEDLDTAMAEGLEQIKSGAVIADAED